MKIIVCIFSKFSFVILSLNCIFVSNIYGMYKFRIKKNKTNVREYERCNK